MDPLAELVVPGENRAGSPRVVVVRVDDRASPGYADRANIERLVPPGPFVLRLRLALLATPRGRALEVPALRQALAFAPEGPEVAIGALRLERPPALPEGVLGWSFAPEGAAPLAGMRAVAPAGARAVRRPGEDPVLARGMAGVTRFVAEVPPGRWRVALWTEDPGEWETLPMVLEQRVRVNGRDLRLVRRDRAAWVAGRYLAGRELEPGVAEAPWAVLGARRGGRVEGEVTVGDEGRLVVELAGHPQAATHLAALLAEPAEAPPRAVAALEALRAARFAEAWPVLSRPAPEPPIAAPRLEGPETAVAAPGGLVLLRFAARGPAGPADVALEGPGRLLWGAWGWRRPAPETPGLVLAAGRWRQGATSLPEGLPRPLLVLWRVPEDAAPGVVRVALRLAAGGGTARAEVTVRVLPLRRPAPAQRVGAFLDLAPHLEGEAARRQAGCDLRDLAAIGLDAVAPPMAAPEDPRFVADVRAAAEVFAPPFLAYAPLRRLAREVGPEAAAAAAVRAQAALEAAGLPAVDWVVADEPSGAGTMARARRLAEALRQAGGGVAAGHLNDPRDAALLPWLGLATINHRFGAGAAEVAALRAGGTAPWLYNLPRPRLGAGFFLWRSAAEGLLQWHARMPTADPYDPTDGREGDVQFLWPTPGVCDPAEPDEDLLALAEGAEDLRWLAWLDQAAAGNAEAAALRARLWREVPARWDARPPAGAEAAWRQAIQALAVRLTAAGDAAQAPP